MPKGPRLLRLLVVLAGLFGAGGVATAALAAHGGGSELLRTASLFLMVHGAAIAAAAALGAAWAGGVMALGTAVFCGDLVLRVWLGQRLLPMAAPAGGVLMILGWLLLAWQGRAGAK